MSDSKLYINIKNINIPYSLSESSKTKHIRLVIDMNGLRVVKPSKARMEDVESFIKAKSGWIYKHHMRFSSIAVDKSCRKWENGETLLLTGESYDVYVEYVKGCGITVMFNGKGFCIEVGEDIPQDEKKALIEEKIKAWYKKAAYGVIKGRLEHFCKITGLKFNVFRIKDQKTRWGSCSRKGNLNFNWRLVMAPLWVVDYVIVHELCHLEFLNHSKDFWDMVGSFMPGYKKAVEWLKKNGRTLNI